MKYLLQKSEKPNHWVCTDTENGIVCIFENNNYNDNHKITFLEDIKKPDPLEIAKTMREMSDWLVENHYEKMF